MIKSVKKKSILNNIRLFFPTIEKVLNNFKSSTFKIINQDKTLAPALALAPAPEPPPKAAHKLARECKISSLKLSQEFLNNIEDNKNNIDDEMIANYYGYPNPSLFRSFFKFEEEKNSKIVNNVTNSLIDLGNKIKKGNS